MVQSVAIASIPMYLTWQLLKSVYQSGHISPGRLNEVHHKYFNIYGLVCGSDRQGTGTRLLRTEPTVWSKVRYMVRTKPRVQFSVLQILLWTWPNRTLTTLALPLECVSVASTICYKDEHECTCGWPGSVPVALHTFKFETQICVSNRWLRTSGKVFWLVVHSHAWLLPGVQNCLWNQSGTSL